MPISSPEPKMNVAVAGKCIPMLVDTGASYSTLKAVPPEYLSKEKIYLTGLTGRPTPLHRTKTLPVTIAGQTLYSSLIASPQTPVNLLGRDLLSATKAVIKCSPDGLIVEWPNGQITHCQEGHGHGCWLASTPQEPPYAVIYWGLLQPSQSITEGLYADFLQWKAWIKTMHPYSATADPLHVTLFYDREHNEEYDILFSEYEGQIHSIQPESIYVHKKGVVASVLLSGVLNELFRRDSDTVPYVSLLLGPGREARELGPLCGKLQSVNDWVPTPIPKVKYSHSQEAFCIDLKSTMDQVMLERTELPRHHGRELTDHENSADMLKQISSVTLQVQERSNVWVPQRKFRSRELAATLEWTSEAEAAFCELRQALAHSA